MSNTIVLRKAPVRQARTERRTVAPKQEMSAAPPAPAAPAASHAALPFVLLGFVWGAVLVMRLLLLGTTERPPRPAVNHAPVVVHPASTAIDDDEKANQESDSQP